MSLNDERVANPFEIMQKKRSDKKNDENKDK